MTSRELEAEYFARFVAARPDLELSNAEHKDAPDFRVQRGTHVLGVEVTRFSPDWDDTGFIPEEQAELRERVLHLAARKYYAAGGAPLHVQVTFTGDRVLRHDRVDELASELAALLSGRAGEILIYENLPCALTDQYSMMPEISDISAFPVATPAQGAWYPAGLGWIGHAGAGDFAGVLARKEPRLAHYRQQTSEVWLLVVFDVLPGEIHVAAPSDPFPLETGFDRVFALERVSGRCLELPTRTQDQRLV